MDDLIDILFMRTWWRFDQRDGSFFSIVYPAFNLVEGIAWLAMAGLVFARYRRHRHSRLEIWYALAFVAFGLSDFREAWAQQSWLLWFKLANLIGLLWLRAVVRRRYYPASKLY